MLLTALILASSAGPLPIDSMPVATYSIVARDSESGQMGVAVQSHWFSVGSVVPWGEAGVGVVATQSMVNPRFGPDGLAQLREGASAAEAVARLVAGDPGSAIRQLAILGADGSVSAHTGASCIAEAGHVVDETGQFSVQANLMANDTVPAAMAAAFAAAEGDLATRLVASLVAAQEAGGDIRGRQSASLLIVAGEASGEPLADRPIDLRVEDHPTPVRELQRLLDVHKAYEQLDVGEGLLAAGDVDGAMAAYERCWTLAPGIVELRAWPAMSLAETGHLDRATPLFEAVFLAEPNWRITVTRAVESGIAEIDEKTLQRILDIGRP